MKPTMKHKAAAGMIAAAAWLWISGAAPASAQDAVDTECVQACVDADKACSDPVREAAVACRESAGCDELLEASRTACQADRTSEECSATRATVRDCLAPCKDAQKEGLDACRENSLTCLRDECGLEGLPPRCRGGRPRHTHGE
jgi:hypothetical protein